MSEMTELMDKVAQIFNEVEDPYDQDDVMGRMFAAGIPFGKLKTLYKATGIKGGFIADPAVVKETITEALDKASEDIEAFSEWSEVTDWADETANEIEGATPTQVLRMLKAYAKDNEIELPKKATGGGPRKRGGALAAAIIEYANSTEGPEMTTEGFYNAVLPAVKGPKNALYYVGAFFPMVYSIKNGISLDQTNAAMKKMPKLDVQVD